MDKFRLLAYWRRFRELLLSRGAHQFMVFLFFLVVSAGFWLLQTLDETFDAEVLVPLELTDVPGDVVITSPLPSQLRVTVRDKGTALLRYWRNEREPVHVSFYDYDNGVTNGRVRLSMTDVQKSVQEHLLSTSKVQAIRPDTLEFYYNHGMNTTVPVAVTGEVKTNSHYYLLDLRAEPAEVRVYASSATLDTLKTVQTKPLNLADVQENTTVEVPLRPIRGAKIEPASVKVTATVDVYMENTVEVPVVTLNFPGSKQLRTFPSTVQVTYTVGYAHSKEVSRKKFVSVITYEEILDLQERGISKIPVRLKTIPEGISNVRIEPSELDYLVEEVTEEE